MEFPGPATLHAVLALATRAPSAHNSQPWRWRVGSEALDLFADPSRQRSPADPDRRDLMLSCGAALHHCTVALAATGWRARVHRLPDPTTPEHLAALELSRRPAEELDLVLSAAIPRRRTDRRGYRSWPVPWGDIALMGARAARAGVMLRQVDEVPAGEVVVALGTETDDDVSLLRAGEATSLVLLSATAMGLASCPVTEPLEAAETRRAVRADVFGDSGYPQMMVRVGWPPAGGDPQPLTPRRPLTEVAECVGAKIRFRDAAADCAP